MKIKKKLGIMKVRILILKPSKIGRKYKISRFSCSKTRQTSRAVILSARAGDSALFVSKVIGRARTTFGAATRIRKIYFFVEFIDYRLRTGTYYICLKITLDVM